MRTMILYGNCQAETTCNVLRASPASSSLFRYLYVPNFGEAQSSTVLSDEDLGSCAILCEQIGWKGFHERDRLNSACVTVRFPPLDSTLLWPFTCPNPYNRPDPPAFPYGRFVNADRVILREIDRGASAEETLQFYLTGWDRYKINVQRARELEWARLKKRDANADVVSVDLIVSRLISEQLFWNICHPKETVLATLIERLLDVCSAHEPRLRDVDVRRVFDEHRELGAILAAVQVPVHPQIAAELSLEWYDPSARYLQYGGYQYSYVEYWTELIRYSIANKQRGTTRDGTALLYGVDWQAPLRGSATADQTVGYFPDGFMGPRLVFRITAQQPTTALTFGGYCPPAHPTSVQLALTIGDITAASIDVQPGSAFTMTADLALGIGESARVEIRSSAVLNMLELGEGEDARDLGVLVTSLDAH